MTIKLEKISLSFSLILAIVIGIYLPTSYNGELFSVKMTILLWIILSGFIILLLMWNKIDKLSLFIALVIVSYLSVISMMRELEGGFDVSLAIMAPIVCLILLTSITFKNIEKVGIEKYLDVFMVVCIVINIGILAGTSSIKNLIYFFYTQYYKEALNYSVGIRKPVFLFGVHSYAAFYYMLFFLLCYFTYKKINKRRFWYYSIILFCFTLLLRSSSSLVFSIYMGGILLYDIVKHKKYFCLSFGFFALILCICKGDLLIQYLESMLSKSNGILGRYTKGAGLFNENMNVITNSLGIGFTIARKMDLYYGDSGYMYFLTLGNVILVVLTYILIIHFIYRNLNKKYARHLCVTILLIEGAVSASTTYRFIAVLIFFVIYLKALQMKNIKINFVEENK